MTGININCKERDFVGLILDGKKWIETRRVPSLRRFVGRRVGLIRTGIGRAQLAGHADIVAEIITDADRAGTCVRGTSFGRFGLMFGYVLANVEPCAPRAIHSRGIVARDI